MSQGRQERRKQEREKRKKVGQLMALTQEMKLTNNPRKAANNYKSIVRLEQDLMQMGLLRTPTKFDIWLFRARRFVAKTFRGFF